MLLSQLAHLFEPWQNLYSNSKLIPAATAAGHLLSMLAGGGLAIAADRTTLRITRKDSLARSIHLEEARDIHRPVLISLVVLFVTGIALAAADIETFAVSPIFWVKMALIALLLLNGALLNRTEKHLRRTTLDDKTCNRLWRAWRRGAVWSIALWSATLIAGVLLVNVA